MTHAYRQLSMLHCNALATDRSQSERYVTRYRNSRAALDAITACFTEGTQGNTLIVLVEHRTCKKASCINLQMFIPEDSNWFNTVRESKLTTAGLTKSKKHRCKKVEVKIKMLKFMFILWPHMYSVILEVIKNKQCHWNKQLIHKFCKNVFMFNKMPCYRRENRAMSL